jgi:transcriptional regulator GlxA family with amidase domain
LQNKSSIAEETAVTEQFYSIAEIAARWKVSRDFVRRLFERETGVLVFGNSPTRGKRRYRTLRVPKDALLRVEKRLAVAGRQKDLW